MSAELPPEVQAVLDAAMRRYPHQAILNSNDAGRADDRLFDAVDAYRKSIAPPEPFERFMGRSAALRDDGGFGNNTGPSAHWFDASGFNEVWRVRVTPIERVK